ncbi:hypothetical protein GCM10027416_11470 [Okibacterium endophyticum]
MARRLRRHPATIREYIHSGRLPAHRLGGREFRVYASDLERLTGPVEEHTAGDAPAESLEEIAARLVLTWPELSPERKRELGRLLAA